MYPSGVPPEVLKELEKDRIEKTVKKNSLCLNCVPGLKGKTNRQKFILKVYGILTVELLITFAFIFLTMVFPSKILSFSLIVLF
jgi:FtsH-binding integral membrane protein